jgi:hypothetical protein
MPDDPPTESNLPRPHYRAATDLYLWHQYQGQDTNDCAAYCVAIAANALLGRAQFDGAEVAREMEGHLHKIPGWATLPWGISAYLQSKHIPARLCWLTSVDTLLLNLKENRTTIVILGDLLRRWGHAKVLYGYEPSGPVPERGFYFVDPGYPREWARPSNPLGVFWQDQAQFKQQWNNLLRISVEIRA